jgi:hypothetical protein
MPKRGMYSAQMSPDDEKVKAEDSPDKQALQAPTIDPVYFGTLGGVLGPGLAGEQLASQLVQNKLLNFLGPEYNRISQYGPRFNPDTKTRWILHNAQQHPELRNKIANPENYGATLRGYGNVLRNKPINTPYDALEGYMDPSYTQKGIGAFSRFMDKLFKTPETHEIEQTLKELAKVTTIGGGKSNIVPFGKGGTIDPSEYKWEKPPGNLSQTGEYKRIMRPHDPKIQQDFEDDPTWPAYEPREGDLEMAVKAEPERFSKYLKIIKKLGGLAEDVEE